MADAAPYERQEVLIRAVEGQYRIEGSINVTNPWPTPLDGLTTGESNWIAVLAGTQFGPVRLRLEYLPEPPEGVDPGWEMVVERDISNEGRGIAVMCIFDQRQTAGLPLPTGIYRVRIHVRNRTEAAQYNIVDSPLEDHLIQIWPAPEHSKPTVLVGPDSEAARRLPPAT